LPRRHGGGGKYEGGGRGRVGGDGEWSVARLDSIPAWRRRRGNEEWMKYRSYSRCIEELGDVEIREYEKQDLGRQGKKCY
jgi:hypothetical protein